MTRLGSSSPARSAKRIDLSSARTLRLDTQGMEFRGVASVIHFPGAFPLTKARAPNLAGSFDLFGFVDRDRTPGLDHVSSSVRAWISQVWFSPWTGKNRACSLLPQSCRAGARWGLCTTASIQWTLLLLPSSPRRAARSLLQNRFVLKYLITACFFYRR